MAAKSTARRVFKINRDRHMVVTPIVQLSFPQLFTPRSYQDDPDAKKVYRCDLIFSKEQLSESYKGQRTQTVSLLTAIRHAKEDMWGPDKNRWPVFQHPTVKNGNTKVNQDNEPIEAYPGTWFITPKTGEKFPPKIVGRHGEKLDEPSVYGGCWVRAMILVRAYETGANKGVALYLNQIMKVKDGDKFGGMPDIEFEVEQDDEDSFEESAESW